MSTRRLARTIGTPGAVLLGLGSILGTGVFVSIGLAADAAGGWVVPATLLAALVATANALSSAQLAAAHPVSGGTYEYGYAFIHPAAGFAAGWLFLCAKSASAATAALGFAGYAQRMLDTGGDAWRSAVAFAAVAALTALVLAGLRRSSVLNAMIVSITVLSLATFSAVIFAAAPERFTPHALEWDRRPGAGSWEAVALMFVAFTGYGRIATLGEEVRAPEMTIPRAIVVTLVISGALYVAVAAAAVAALGSADLATATLDTGAPLEAAALAVNRPWLARVVATGAMTAMLAVLLNLILGLSRVVLAMGRRGDAPPQFAALSAGGGAAPAATIGVGLAIAVITAAGSIKFAWSFSAFTVLMYYALTNLAALRLSTVQRRYPRWIAWSGLVSCVALAWWVEPRAWLTGLAVLVLGFVLRRLTYGRFSAPAG